VVGERYGCRGLRKAALSAIDDWLDEEIVGFEPNESYQVILVFGRASLSIAFCESEMLFPLFGKQSERYYQEKFAREIGGKVEVVMKDGTRCDILTAT
jgi:hypothetical protein